VIILDSKELYQKAYDLHYKNNQFNKALELYDKIIKEYPESDESKYAQTQIENIKNMSNFDRQRLKPIEPEKEILTKKNDLEKEIPLSHSEPEKQLVSTDGRKNKKKIDFLIIFGTILITGGITLLIQLSMYRDYIITMYREFVPFLLFTGMFGLFFGTPFLAIGIGYKIKESLSASKISMSSPQNINKPQRFCPKCGREIPFVAIVCPYCKHDFGGI
jgi:tetratricopeptide (TPR) repeat protein